MTKKANANSNTKKQSVDEAQEFLDSLLLDDNQTKQIQPEISSQLSATAVADSPVLLKSLASLTAGIKATKLKLDELKHQIPSLPTSFGVSLLELKLHSLLSYLTSLSFFILMKLQGKSTANTSPTTPCISKLVELRVVLEKIRPIEAKLKYQIDKVLKAATECEKVTAHGETRAPISEVDLGASGILDPLQFRPNPKNFVGAAAAEKSTNDAPTELGGVYRPPRITPLKYTGDISASAKKPSLSTSTRDSLSKSRLFRDMRETFDTTRPEQVTSHGTGYGVREMRDTRDEELEKIQEFELNNYQRLGATRDRNKREKAAMRRAAGGGGGIMDEMENLETDFLRMEEVDRAVGKDDREKYGAAGSVLSKRNARAEEMFGTGG
ncbi:hypothetical protein HK100_000051, partial [Physocladia obscura]